MDSLVGYRKCMQYPSSFFLNQILLVVFEPPIFTLDNVLDFRIEVWKGEILLSYAFDLLFLFRQDITHLSFLSIG